MPKRAGLPLKMTKEQTEAWRRAGERYRARRRAKKDKRGKKTQPVTNARVRARRRIRRAPPGHPKTIRVVIFTYERPHALLSLLRDVYAWRGPYRISVAVYDDASSDKYERPRRMLDALGWQFVRAANHHGKRNFWRWVSHVYAAQRTNKEEFFVFLPDDVRLCVDFFHHLCEQWSRIADPEKIALSPLRDSGGNRGWTRNASAPVGEVLLTGFVDLIVGCPRAYLEALDYSCPPVSPRRWSADPTLGSGIGPAISARLRELDLSMYSVSRSLVVHTGLEASRMNPKERSKNPLRAVSFVDGEHSHEILLRRPDECVVSIASMGYRSHMLAQVVDSLYWQVDRINVYLNNYAAVPKFLKRPKIQVALSQKHGDRGDAGKFFWSDALPGSCYHFTCDDDILYPQDYVARMRHHVEQYGRKALVSLHGACLRRLPSGSFYNQRVSLLRCTRSVAHDTPVHIPGTGVLAYHVSTIRLRPEMFRCANMADVWVGLAAKQQGIPVVVARHGPRWILTIPDPRPERSIFERYKRRDAVQAKLIRRAAPWNKPVTVERVG